MCVSVCARARVFVCMCARACVCVLQSPAEERYHQSVIHWRECIIIYMLIIAAHNPLLLTARDVGAHCVPLVPQTAGAEAEVTPSQTRPVSGSTDLRGGCRRQYTLGWSTPPAQRSQCQRQPTVSLSSSLTTSKNRSRIGRPQGSRC